MKLHEVTMCLFFRAYMNIISMFSCQLDQRKTTDGAQQHIAIWDSQKARKERDNRTVQGSTTQKREVHQPLHSFEGGMTPFPWKTVVVVMNVRFEYFRVAAN